MALKNIINDLLGGSTRFVNSNPTIDTGVKLQGDTTTAWVATTPSILIVNNDTGAAFGGSAVIKTGTKRIALDQIWLRVTGAGAGLTTLECAIIIDDINRYASGGTDVSANSTSADDRNNPASIAKVYYGATASAADSARVVGRAILRGAIPVVNDQYILDFGAMGVGGESASAISGTAVIAQAFKIPPLVIGAGQSALIYLWATSMSTSPATEFMLSWLEG